MSPANQDKHAELLRQADELRAAARRARNAAAHADSSQDRIFDEQQARDYDRKAHDLESQAAALMESDP